MKNTEAALKWIVGVLRSHEIPFQITGGFAARIYGSQRELADIDITILGSRMNELVEVVKEFVVYGPQRYQDAEYDLLLMTLNYEGQEIDIDTETMDMFDTKAGKWVTCVADVGNAVLHEVYGLKVPVIPARDLISYKQKLAREVDLLDVRALRALGY